MTLDQISAAIKPQFVWDNYSQLEADKILYNGIGSSGLGKIVFIGIANLNGFKIYEIMQFLNIETRVEYYNKLNDFKRAIKSYAEGKRDKETKTIYTKADMIISHLNTHARKQAITLTDFKY